MGATAMPVGCCITAMQSYTFDTCIPTELYTANIVFPITDLKRSAQPSHTLMLQVIINVPRKITPIFRRRSWQHQTTSVRVFLPHVSDPVCQGAASSRRYTLSLRSTDLVWVNIGSTRRACYLCYFPVPPGLPQQLPSSYELPMLICSVVSHEPV